MNTTGTRRFSQPVHLVLDYDGTLTSKDTMAVLGDLPKQPKMGWEEIVDAYMKDYQAYKEQPYPWKAYDRKEYSGWLAARKWVESNSAQRVQDANFFRGVTLDEVNESVRKAMQDRKLEFRDGWQDLFELFLPHYNAADGTTDGSRISILSVNWSETAIRRALWEAAACSKGSEKSTLSRYINDMQIFANEIEGLGSPEGSSGRVCGALQEDIRTSDDKLRFLSFLKDENKEQFVVYVGDSSTDFDCLCDADVGVWLCDAAESQYEQSFMETFRPFRGFVPPPLRSDSDLEANKGIFFWAPSFDSVLEMLRSQ